jgi:hypothetical protein
LLAEVLSARIPCTQTALKPSLCRFHFVYFRGLSSQLAVKIGDHFVALGDLCISHHAVMAGIAQLLLK